MKIVCKFADRLYAIREEGQLRDELSRLLGEWADPVFLFQFLKANSRDLPVNKTIITLANTIIENAGYIDRRLKELSSSKTQSLETFFAPLNNHQYQLRILNEQKGRENYLRIYALKIDDNCFIITGGAIKFTQFMEDRIHTETELAKINRCRDYLIRENVFDLISFKDLLNEKK